MEQAGAHGGDGMVEHAQQAGAALVERLHQLEIAHGEAVEAHVAVFLDARDGGDVGGAGVLCLVEVVHDGTGGDDGVVHAVESESFERQGVKLPQQALAGGVEGVEPLVELKGEVAVGELGGHAVFEPAHHQQLLGGHAGHELVDVAGRALGGHELAGADVEKCHSRGVRADMDGGQEVVFGRGEHIVVEAHAGGHQLGDAALDELLGELGVFELLAYGHALAGAHQSRQVCVEGVVGETCEFYV